MTRQSGDVVSREHLLSGITPASGMHVENFPRWAITTDGAIAATGVCMSAAVAVQAGDVVTNISFKSGATAAGTPTAWFFALYDPDLALMAQSADQATAAWAANATKTLPLATAQLCRLPGVYYACIAVTATTVPTILGRSLALAGASTGVLAAESALVSSHGSAVGGVAPATIATPTDTAVIPYVVLS